MKRYVLSRRAGDDLDYIWLYSAQTWNDEQADRYYRELIEVFSDLALSPQKGRAADGLWRNYRRYAVRSHVIFYRDIASGIEIIRILHQRMDFDRHL